MIINFANTLKSNSFELLLFMEKYRILAIIGEGTYGKVFKAQSKEDGRVVAIKKFK